MTKNTMDIASSSRNRNRSSSLRWTILATNCIAMTGVYYSYDIPSALHRPLESYMSSIDHSTVNFAVMFNLLYTVYSVPNIILPFFAGNIVDRFQSPTCMILFGCLTCLGQIILAFGTLQKSWFVMLLGRFIYGLGGESIGVASSTLNSEWFHGQELALAFGVNLAMSRMGSVLNNMLSPFLADRKSPSFAVWIGVCMNTITVLASISIYYLQKKRKIYSQDSSESDRMSTSVIEHQPTAQKDWEDNNDYFDPTDVDAIMDDCDSPLEDREYSLEDNHMGHKECHLCDTKKFGPLFWLISASCLLVYGCILPFNNVASGILLQRNYFKKAPADCTLKYPDECTYGDLQPIPSNNPSINSKGIACPLDKNNAPILPTSIHVLRNSTESTTWKKDSYMFDILSASDVDCMDPFWSRACTKNYCDVQQDATEKSGRVMSIPYFMSAFLAPYLGHVVDKIEKRAIIASFASLMLGIVHLILAISQSSPILPLIGQGFAYSLYAAVIWPSVPLTVKPKYTGTAFGAITAIQNIGMAIFPLIIAGIYNRNQSFIPYVEYFFVACAFLGVGIGIVINIIDSRTGNRLNGHLKCQGSTHGEDNGTSLAPLLHRD